MTKIFRKSLALVITLAMCLTAVTACFVVSAEDPTDTITFSSPAVTEGATEITVTLDIASQGFLAQLVTFNYDSRLGVPTATIPGDAQYDIETNLATAGTVKYILDGWGATDIYAATITLTFTAPTEAGFAADDYAFTFVSAEAANDEEVNINFTPAGTWGITVAAAQQACEHSHLSFYSDDTHEVVLATGTTTGETSKGKIYFKCDDCGEIIEEELGFYYYYCTGYSNLNLEAEILANFDAREDHLSKQGAYQDAIVVLDQHFEGFPTNRVVTKLADTESVVVNSKNCHRSSVGVAAKGMTDMIDSYVFVKYNGSWYNGTVISKSVESFALTGLADTASSKELKDLYANMLAYGSKAQINFNYKTNQLADANLGTYASLVNTSIPSIEDTSVNPLITNLDHVGFHTYSLSLGSKVEVYLGFRTDKYTGSEDFGELSVKCSYINDLGQTVEKVYTNEEYGPIGSYTNRFELLFDGIAAKDMRKTITAQVVNANGSVGYNLTTSIESVARKLINGNSNNTNLVNTVYAMMHYGDYANTYMNSK